LKLYINQVYIRKKNKIVRSALPLTKWPRFSWLDGFQNMIYDRNVSRLGESKIAKNSGKQQLGGSKHIYSLWGQHLYYWRKPDRLL